MKKLLHYLMMSTRYLMYSLIIQCLLVTVLLAGNSNAQVQSINEVVLEGFELKDSSIKDALIKIEKLTNFNFVYTKSDLPGGVAISFSKSRVTVGEVLLEMSKQAQIKFQQVNNNISVKKINSQLDEKQEKIEVIIQTRTITGKVTSYEDKEGLPGVNVVEKGTSNGTVTDVQGNYSLEVSEGATLVFSSVGYTPEEVEVGNRSVIDLTMTQDIQQLQELVVVGYGTMEKRDVTGAIASVSGEQLSKLPIASVESGIQGRVPGVLISQNNASPGGAANVRIRGGNTILGGSEPLYVIDGYPVYNDVGSGSGEIQASNPLASINPNDIETINVLKDASATAIYGARGANGVILITTKRGKRGEANISLDAYYGVQEVSNTYDLMGREDFMTIVNERFRNGGLAERYSNFSEYPDNTDWQNEIFTTAPIQNYNLTFSGGDEKNRYSISGNYFSQDGIVKNSGFERGALRINLDNQLTDKLLVNTSITASKSLNDRARSGSSANQGMIYMALVSPPNAPIFDAEGNYFDITTIPGTDPSWNNPVFVLDKYSNDYSIDRILGNTLLTYEILEGISLDVRLGADLRNELTEAYFPIGLTTPTEAGRASVSHGYTQNFLSEFLFKYNKILNENHHINAVAGYTWQKQYWRNYDQSGDAFNSDIFRTYNLGAAEITNPNGSFKGDFTILSWLGRVNYSFANKYLATISARADGSSRFGEGNKWGFFPSAAFAWRLSEENFMSGLTVINDLKLRSSFGITGNQEIGSYQSLSRLNSVLTVLGQNENPIVGFGPAELGNPDLQWETTEQFDVGFDMTIWNERLTVSADFYQKNTNDLLAPIPLPLSSGFSSVIKNLGKIRNTGFELAINSTIIQSPNFNWSANANFSSNKNEVVEWATEESFAPGVSFPVSASVNIIREGDPLSSFIGYLEDGLNEEGLIQYQDLNNDEVINADDRTILGTPFPDFTYNLSSDLRFKEFDFSFFFQGQNGNSVFNFNNFVLGDAFARESNQLADVVNRWSADNPNPNAPYPKASATAQLVSDRHIEDASFLRLRNVTLGYTIPLEGFDRFRIYVSGDNLLTFTKYSGFDPEISSYSGSDLRMGVDMGAYPAATTYRMGLNISF